MTIMMTAPLLTLLAPALAALAAFIGVLGIAQLAMPRATLSSRRRRSS